MRGQPVAGGPGGGAGTVRLRWPGAGGDGRRRLVPADRRDDLPADPAALRLLLVLPGRRLADAELARGTGGAHGRAADSGDQARPAGADPGARPAHPGEGPAEQLPGPPPLVQRPRERHRRAGTGLRAAFRRLARPGRGHPRRRALPAAAGLRRRRLGRQPAGPAAGPGAPAPRPPGRPADRRLQPAGIHLRGARPPARPPGAPGWRRRNPLPARQSVRRLPGGGGRGDPADLRRTVQQLGDHRRAHGAQAGAPPVPRRAPGGGDGRLPHRPRLRQHRAAAGRGAAGRRRRRARHPDDPAGLPEQPGRCLGVDPDQPAAGHPRRTERRHLQPGERVRRPGRAAELRRHPGPAPGRDAPGAGAAQRRPGLRRAPHRRARQCRVGGVRRRAAG